MNTPKNENNPKTKEELELEKEKRENQKKEGNEDSGFIPPLPERKETPRQHDDPLRDKEPGTF